MVKPAGPGGTGRSRSKLNNRQVKMARERDAAARRPTATPKPRATPKPQRAPWDIPGKIADAVGGRGRASAPRASARARLRANSRSRINRPKVRKAK